MIFSILTVFLIIYKHYDLKMIKNQTTPAFDRGTQLSGALGFYLNHLPLVLSKSEWGIKVVAHEIFVTAKSSNSRTIQLKYRWKCFI